MADRVTFGETSCMISQVLTDGVGVSLALSETGRLTYGSTATGTTELLRGTDS